MEGNMVLRWIACRIYCFLAFLVFGMPLLAFEKVSPSGQVVFPKSTGYHCLSVDVVGRIYLGVRKKNYISVYNKFGTQIDTIRFDFKGLHSRGGDIQIDRLGNIIVLDTAKRTLSKYSANVSLMFSIGAQGGADRVFRSPTSIAIDSESNIYVADIGLRQVQVFSPEGIYIGSLDSGDQKQAKSSDYRLMKHEVYTGKTIPKAPVFKSPLSITVGPEKLVYVLDNVLKFVFIYNSNGRYMGNIDLKEASGRSDILPLDLAISSESKILILDGKYHTIRIFNREGLQLGEVGRKGTGIGQFFKPSQLFYSNGLLYVLDSGNNRVQMFKYGKPSKENKQSELNPIVNEKEKARLAVFDFKNNNQKAKDKKLAQTISEMAITALVKGDHFKLVERKEINNVLTELNLDISGMVDSRSVKEVGKLLGSDIGLIGSVSILDDSVDMDIRLIDLKTGLIIQATSKSVEKQESLRETVADAVHNIERGYLNRMKAPQSPKSLISIPGAQSVFLRWEKNSESDVIGYNIYSKKNEENSFRKIATTKLNEFEYKVPNINSARVVYVTAIDSEGKESSPSIEIAANTRKLPDFGYILKVRHKIEAKKISFSWKKPESEDIKEYQIYRSDSISSDFTLVGTTIKQEFIDNGLSDGKTYFYKIRRVYRTGILSEFSNVIELKTDAIPKSVTRFESQSDLPQKIKITWSPSKSDRDIKNFLLLRSEYPAEGFKKLKQFSYSTRSYVDRKLSNNTTYYYKMKVIDKSGLESEESEVIAATTKDIPPTPVQMIAESGLPKKIIIKWQKIISVPGITYIIYRSENSEGPFNEVGKTSQSRFEDKKLDHDKSFYYFVSAKDRDGLISNPSEIVSAKTKKLPEVPNGLKSIGELARKITVVWEKNHEADIVKYLIHLSKKANSYYKTIGETSETHFSYEKRIKDGEAYYIKISAVDEDGLESAYTESIVVKTKSKPPVPSDVVVEFKNNKIVLSWPPVHSDDIFGYAIFINGKKKAIVKENIFVEDIFNFGQRYSFQVSSVDGSNLMSGLSKKVSIRLPKEL